MNKKYFIKASVAIQKNKIYHNQKRMFTGAIKDSLPDFLKNSYQFLKMDYPKFHKMDELCKLGMLATEIFQQNYSLKNNTALVFQNSESCLVTDKKHQQSIQNQEQYFPSPAIFVYTLPNIVMGEISIKYQLNSENAFFIAEKFDAEFLQQYNKIILETESAEEVISGWIDLNTHSYDVFLALISKTGKTVFNAENFRKIYQSYHE